MTTATLPQNTKKVFKLPTQAKRAGFARREMRSQGLSVSDVADQTGHCWGTINNYMQEITKDPRTATTVNIFRALGYDVAFVVRKDAKGRVEIT